MIVEADEKKTRQPIFWGLKEVPASIVPASGLASSMWKIELLNHGQLGLLCVCVCMCVFPVVGVCLAGAINSISPSRLAGTHPGLQPGRSPDLG